MTVHEAAALLATHYTMRFLGAGAKGTDGVFTVDLDYSISRFLKVGDVLPMCGFTVERVHGGAIEVRVPGLSHVD